MQAPLPLAARNARVSLRSIVRVGSVVLILYSFAGAGRAAGQVGTRAGVIVRDSAGITIVENADSAWTSSIAWTIADSPSLQIGSQVGVFGPAFGRISDAARLTDGRFAVADPMARQVVFVDPRGRSLALAGGPGDGPAEFRQMGGLWVLRGDTVAVEGVQSGKIVCFDSAGIHARTIMAPRRGWNGHTVVELAGVRPDGSFFVTSFPQKWEYPPGTGITEAPLYYFDRNGVAQGLIDSLPARQTVNEGGIQEDVALGPVRTFAVDETGIWFGFPITYELRHITPEGVDRIIRRSAEREAVSRAFREQWREWRRSAFREGAPDFVWEALEREPIADSLPAFNQIQISSDGHIWVEEPYTLSEQTPETWELGIPPGRRPWSVFDPSGRWLGTVRMPEGLRVTEIGPDHVLGVWKNEWDVSFVRIYRINKPTQGDLVPNK